MTKNALNWFEIPVSNIGRASRFYGAVLQQELEPKSFGPHAMHVFQYQQPGVGGCLIEGEQYNPATDGAVVYLPVADNMNAALTRVKDAGGKVTLGRTELPGDMGCFAHIMDTEGNRVGLHALN